MHQLSPIPAAEDVLMATTLPAVLALQIPQQNMLLRIQGAGVVQTAITRQEMHVLRPQIAPAMPFIPVEVAARMTITLQVKAAHQINFINGIE